MSTQAKVDSTTPFRRYALCWMILGVRLDGKPYCLGIWELLLTLGITIGYPLHLTIGLFYSETMKEIFGNLVVSVAIIACSVKIVTFRLRLRQMQQVRHIMRELDKRVQYEEEHEYLRGKLLPAAYRVVNVFYVLYGSTFLMSVIALIMGRERRLLYPGWFPYDWSSSTLSYTLTASYQCWGLGIEAVQSLANDVFGPLSLCVFAGHVHMLKIRLSQVGYDQTKTARQHHQDLIACMEDYSQLIKIYKIIRDTLTVALFTQFVSGGLSIGVAVIYILFYVDDFFTYLYYILQLLVFFGELFPCCYYGSLMELEFRDMPYAVFSCNWIEQQQSFKRITMIFAGLTLRTITVFAGGMIRIHIDSFFATCKMAYSFFALMITMK